MADKSLDYKKDDVVGNISEKDGTLRMAYLKDDAKTHSRKMETITVEPDGRLVVRDALFSDQPGAYSKIYEGYDTKLLADIKAAYKGFQNDGVLDAKEVDKIRDFVKQAPQKLKDQDTTPPPKGGAWR